MPGAHALTPAAPWLRSSSRLDAHLCVWALSGLFAATFPLAFAYISDHVPAPSLVQAYGIALGCGLGLALMVGPISGTLLALALARTLASSESKP